MVKILNKKNYELILTHKTKHNQSFVHSQPTPSLNYQNAQRELII